jgi:hypothetical protein
MPEKPGEVASLALFTTNGGLPANANSVYVGEEQFSSTLSIQLFLKLAPTTPVAYETQSEEELNVQFAENNQVTLLLQNRPNPFRDMTSVLCKVAGRKKPY